MGQENIEIKLHEGQKELIIRTGTADVIEKPLAVRIFGTISAPRLWIEKRKSQVVAEKASIVFSRTFSRSEGQDWLSAMITLSTDEKDPRGTIIIGKLYENPDLTKFQINTTGGKTLRELSQFIYFNRSFFAEQDTHKTFLKNLDEFKAKIDIEIEKSDDKKGNKTDHIQTKVLHAIPLNFKLSLPLFVGQTAKTFLVEVVPDITSSSITFYLRSVELAELQVNEKNRILDEELKALAEYVIIEN